MNVAMRPGDPQQLPASGAIIRSMAMEFAPPKVGVNPIVPSTTMTHRVHGRLEAGNARVENFAVAPLAGLIAPEDIARMAVFLASEEAWMIPGHVYPVDSGMTMS